MQKSLLLVLASLISLSAQAGVYGANFKVASINLLHDFPFMKYVDDRLELVAQAILENDIDVVGLQEASVSCWNGDVVEKLANLTGYHSHWAPGEGFSWAGFQTGNAMLSKYPITEVEDVRLANTRGFTGLFEKRSVLRAVIDSPWGPVNVFSTHLTGAHKESNFDQTVTLGDLLEEHASDAPSFILGDFNAEPHSDSIKNLTEHYGFVDTFAQMNPGVEGNTCCVCVIPDYNNIFDSCGGRNNDSSRRRVDYVFMYPGRVSLGQVTSAKRFLDVKYDHHKEDWIRASDHYSVMAGAEW